MSSKKTTKWKDRGFDDKHHYAGWLHFNGLTDDSKMYDDTYYDEYTGRVVNITAPDAATTDADVDEAEKFLKSVDENKEIS